MEGEYKNEATKINEITSPNNPPLENNNIKTTPSLLGIQPSSQNQSFVNIEKQQNEGFQQNGPIQMTEQETKHVEFAENADKPGSAVFPSNGQLNPIQNNAMLEQPAVELNGPQTNQAPSMEEQLREPIPPYTNEPPLIEEPKENVGIMPENKPQQSNQSFEIEEEHEKEMLNQPEEKQDLANDANTQLD